MTSKNNNSNNNNNGGGGVDGLENWREYFRRANSDIFDIIEHGIMVAASDCPKEFRVRREKIAELLFTCRLTRCLGCDRVELAVSEVENGEGGGEVKMVVKNDVVNGGGGSKGSKVNSTTSNNNFDQMMRDTDLDMILNNESNYSFDDAEALTNEIEEARELVEEVLRIKEILLNCKEESEAVLFDSLRRLQLMSLNVDILKSTEIGKAVNVHGIKRHNSKEISHLARSLIDGWKTIVDEWVKTSQELAEGGTPDSVNPSTVDEEEGLPSPPLDDGVFFSTQTMDITQFFDGMDDDGNPRNSGEFNKSQEVRDVGRKPSVAKQEPPKRREEPPKQVTPPSRDNKVQLMKKQEPLSKPNKPLNTQSGPGRPVKPNVEPKINNDSRVQQKPVVQRRPPPQPEKMRPSSDNAVQEKLEASKRKLQERYQQAENAKRQRTIQVMEIQDIPKQGFAKPNAFGKFGNNRSWANGRR